MMSPKKFFSRRYPQKDIDKMPDKEFEGMIIRKVTEIGENTNGLFNKVREVIQCMNEKISKI